MGQPLRFAWLSLVRQRARAGLGILGVAAIGALLLDMLLLSRGLVLSFGELLERSGFDVRVLASDAPPFAGPQLTGAMALARRIAALPEVAAVHQLRARDAEIAPDAGEGFHSTNHRADRQPARDRRTHRVAFVGVDSGAGSIWRIIAGEHLTEPATGLRPLMVNRNLARRFGLSPGSTVSLRGRCGDGSSALPPVTFTVVGIAEFPFDSATASTVAGPLTVADELCGDENADRADLLLVRSTPQAGALAAARAVLAAEPAVHAVTNEELLERFSRVEFSYFRQISVVLATVTLFFGFLLIAVLLTVSVNQRLGEIAALRAIGLSRSRVVAGVMWESTLLVGAGGLLALPLGMLLSVWLDAILRSMPGVPAGLHFFVFEPRAALLYAALLAVASLAAAAYPMRIVAVLPIAATLRREIVS